MHNDGGVTLRDMWKAQSEPLQGDVIRFRLFQQDVPITYRELVALLRHNARFREWFSTTLAAAPMQACFWESRPVTLANVDDVYECVLIDAPMLASQPENSTAFRNVFDAAAEDIVCFDNIGHDALLVAPAPTLGQVDHAHLLGFLRTAPGTRIQLLWRVVSERVESSLSALPLWVSTSGLGVPWLHIRLDSMPKYYNYGLYRLAGANRV